MNVGERSGHKTETGTLGGKMLLSRYKTEMLRPTHQDQRKLSFVALVLLVCGPLAQCLAWFHGNQVGGRSGRPMAVEPWVAKEV
jgi:hypothetical protein